jgi:hypothetical protein
LGYLGVVTVQRSGSFLIVTTGVGIECGYDQSAYIYTWTGEKWTRIWQNEQDTYTEKEYWPQTLQSVVISPYSPTNDYLVLTLGTESWCASNWHNVYYRVFRLGPDLQAPPLVNGADWAYLGRHDPPIQGSLAADDVLVEYTVSSIDGGVHSREAIRHYQIDRDKATRVDPLALSPRDFVDEWLVTDWRKAAFWSESPNRRAMLNWREQVQKDRVFGEFVQPTLHCAKTPDLWQVGVEFSETGAANPAAVQRAYFLVRWRPPYQFRMVQVGDAPSRDCTETDPGADDERRTLFPTQQWR